jgi:FKBP-type peptidyl-prolyl cis-trans isomerase FkpA
MLAAHEEAPMRRSLWLVLLVWGICTPAAALAADAAGAGKEAKPAPAPAQKPAGQGLVVETLVEGSGPSPKATDTVRVHYHGTFADGRVFDSSVQRGQPATFPLSRVIPCWTQGLQQMKVGGKAKLTCPPELAYGARGYPPRIPPNATLYFDVELLGIEKPAPRAN